MYNTIGIRALALHTNGSTIRARVFFGGIESQEKVAALVRAALVAKGLAKPDKYMLRKMEQEKNKAERKAQEEQKAALQLQVEEQRKEQARREAEEKQQRRLEAESRKGTKLARRALNVVSRPTVVVPKEHELPSYEELLAKKIKRPVQYVAPVTIVPVKREPTLAERRESELKALKARQEALEAVKRAKVRFEQTRAKSIELFGEVYNSLSLEEIRQLMEAMYFDLRPDKELLFQKHLTMCKILEKARKLHQEEQARLLREALAKKAAAIEEEKAKRLAENEERRRLFAERVKANRKARKVAIRLHQENLVKKAQEEEQKHQEVVLAEQAKLARMEAELNLDL